MKEFLTTNINGSYANMGLNGELARMYAGYLVVSLTPPQDRVVALEWVDEHIIGCANEFEKDAEYTENGCIPTMHTAAGDIDFTRSVVLKNDADAVKLVYEISNRSDRAITLKLEPWLTFRRPESVAAQGDLEFEKKTEIAQGEYFSASFVPKKSPYPEIPCVITLMAKAETALLRVSSNGAANGCFTGKSRYTKDEETGDPGVALRGTCYVPYSFETLIPAGGSAVVTVLCAVHRTDAKAEVRGTDVNPENQLQAVPETSASLMSFFNAPLSELRKAGEAAFLEALRRARFDEVKAGFSASHPETVELYRELVLSASKFITKKTGTSYKTVMAGYPWFLDWGRDTMIAFTGLLLVTGQFDTARDVLRSFARYVRHGMVPNVFPSGSADEPQYNTVDASLWFFYAADMYARFSGDEAFVKTELYPVLTQIINLYTRSFAEMQAAPAEAFCYGIYMDSEGFVHAGTDESDQLTWMDVRIDGKAVTPRHDCPVEIQALMYNALNVMLKYAPQECEIHAYPEKNASEECGTHAHPGNDTQDSGSDRNFHKAPLARYKALAATLRENAHIFINPDKKCLYDYIEGVPGHRKFNGQIRPNQIWAVSLPYTLFDRDVCADIVNTVKEQLVADLGLRSLAPSEPEYIAKYEGCLKSRDKAYHNGTAWGFLAGPYIMAYLKTVGNKFTETQKLPASAVASAGNLESFEYLHKLLLPYLDHMQNDGCMYGIAEVFDGDSPKTGKGCYNQAWSVGCLLEAIWAMVKA